MAFDSAKYLDNFAPWVRSLNYTNGRWVAQFYPNKIVDAISIFTVVDALKRHVIWEVIDLCCEALDVNPDYLTKKGRKQAASDDRAAVAAVLFDIFNKKIALKNLAKELGWADQAMIYWALNQRDVRPVANKINIIFSRYPFLKDGFKSLR